MIDWLRDLHWELYFEQGWQFLPKPPLRPWRVLLLPGMEPPEPRPGFEQRIIRMPSTGGDAP